MAASHYHDDYYSFDAYITTVEWIKTELKKSPSNLAVLPIIFRACEKCKVSEDWDLGYGIMYAASRLKSFIRIPADKIFEDLCVEMLIELLENVYKKYDGYITNSRGKCITFMIRLNECRKNMYRDSVQELENILSKAKNNNGSWFTDIIEGVMLESTSLIETLHENDDEDIKNICGIFSSINVLTSQLKTLLEMKYPTTLIQDCVHYLISWMKYFNVRYEHHVEKNEMIKVVMNRFATKINALLLKY